LAISICWSKFSNHNILCCLHFQKVQATIVVVVVVVVVVAAAAAAVAKKQVTPTSAATEVEHPATRNSTKWTHVT